MIAVYIEWIYKRQDNKVKICSAEAQTGNKTRNNSKHYFKLVLIFNKTMFQQLKLENTWSLLI